MGQHRLIVVDMDYGSQSETLVNCDMWNTDHDVEVKKMPVATHGLLWLFSSSFNISSCSVWIFHAEIALMLDV